MRGWATLTHSDSIWINWAAADEPAWRHCCRRYSYDVTVAKKSFLKYRALRRHDENLDERKFGNRNQEKLQWLRQLRIYFTIFYHINIVWAFLSWEDLKTRTKPGYDFGSFISCESSQRLMYSSTSEIELLSKRSRFLKSLSIKVNWVNWSLVSLSQSWPSSKFSKNCWLDSLSQIFNFNGKLSNF